MPTRIFLTHATASQYWIHRDMSDWLLSDCVPGSHDIPTSYSANDAKRLVLGLHDGDVHLAVRSCREMRRISNVVLHSRKVAYPRKSFCRVAKDVYVARPELCFLQAASVLTFPALIMYGFELCGTYARTDSGARYQRIPLTDREKILGYLAKSSGTNGIKNALSACRHIFDGSASPRESALAAMLTLPPILGGAGLPRPTLNCPITVGVPDKENIGKPLELHGDITWPDAKLVIEYDGLQHNEPVSHDRDKQRDHLMLDAGYNVVRFTNSQIESLEEVGRLIRTVNRMGHYRRRTTSLAIDKRKAELHDAILFKSDLPWLENFSCEQ